MSDASFKYPESSLPFTEYSYNGGTMTQISADGRGSVRPGWDIWAGYCAAHGVKATYITEFAERYRPDGGGGHRLRQHPPRLRLQAVLTNLVSLLSCIIASKHLA